MEWEWHSDSINVMDVKRAMARDRDREREADGDRVGVCRRERGWQRCAKVAKKICLHLPTSVSVFRRVACDVEEQTTTTTKAPEDCYNG